MSASTPKKKRLMREVSDDEKPRHRPQHYRREWESSSQFHDWIQADKEDTLKAICKVCNISLKAEISAKESCKI